jgi:DNA repair protein RecN (Recombination protein N)
MDRRALITGLTRKYADPGDGLDGVLAWADDARRRLSELDVSDEALDKLAAERDAARAEVDNLGARISAGRRSAAEGFAAEVGRELAGLAMKSARVSFSVESNPDEPGPDGLDQVALLLAAHPGAPPRPVQKGASGGELSRVMLAIEVVFAGADPVPVMVFDEVDAGVGGQAAGEIGRRLAQLGQPAPGRRRHPPRAGGRLRRHPPRRRQVT